MLFNQSDYVNLLKSIKQKMGLWLEKGEFEKTEDYQTRITNYQNQYDSICYKEIYQEIIERSFSYKGNINRLQYNSLEVLPEQYNADNEEYIIKVKYGNCTWRDTLKMGIENAKQFKDNFKIYEAFVHPKDWSFYEHYLTPNRITLIRKDTDENIILEMNNVTTYPIIIDLTKLNIKNNNQNYIFNYSRQFTFNKSKSDIEEQKTKQTEENERKFNSLVNQAHNIYRYGAYRKNKNIHPLMKEDVIKETNEIISYLEKALKIKSDEKVEKELNEYKEYLKEIKRK